MCRDLPGEEYRVCWLLPIPDRPRALTCNSCNKRGHTWREGLPIIVNCRIFDRCMTKSHFEVNPKALNHPDNV